MIFKSRRKQKILKKDAKINLVLSMTLFIKSVYKKPWVVKLPKAKVPATVFNADQLC